MSLFLFCEMLCFGYSYIHNPKYDLYCQNYHLISFESYEIKVTCYWNKLICSQSVVVLSQYLRLCPALCKFVVIFVNHSRMLFVLLALTPGTILRDCMKSEQKTCKWTKALAKRYTSYANLSAKMISSLGNRLAGTSTMHCGHCRIFHLIAALTIRQKWP